MIDEKFYVNTFLLMLSRPRSRCTLHEDRAETLQELPIVKVTGIDCDYYDGTNT